MSDLIKHYRQLVGIAKGWAMKSLPGWSDDSHRDLLARYGAVEIEGRISASSMNVPQLDAVLCDYERRGWSRTKRVFDGNPSTGSGRTEKRSVPPRIAYMVRMWGTVANRKFEATLDVPREKIEDDNYGMYGDIAQSYGLSVTDLKNDLVFGLIAAGFAGVCYDSQFFFDTDHPVYPNEDGTGVATTVSNMQAGVLEPWVLLCTERAPKPFYLQERVPAEFVAKTSAANGDGVFENDVFSYGGRWRGDVVFGFWQLAFGSKAALDVANFEAAFKAMEKFKGDGNRKLGITPDLLVCGPDNRSAAEALLKANQNANGASNINYNKVKLIVTPWMAL